jgi:hypothetical protein
MRCFENAAPPPASIARSVTATAASSEARRACSTASAVDGVGSSISASAMASRARACSVRTLISARRARSVGSSRSLLPRCLKVATWRWRAVTSTAVRHRPLAMAAVPTQNQGRITSSVIFAPSPIGVIRAPSVTR